ncbi:hypothetical protein [Arthrobacter sp. ok362]|uniref:hypothetical protein n=1 Tax=Arthrobacter sp. ok362 TaxID=1761745 RepID=UPI0011136469|nr:hypothetical protein [Arthrobacter sp. ok362]
MSGNGLNGRSRADVEMSANCALTCEDTAAAATRAGPGVTFGDRTRVAGNTPGAGPVRLDWCFPAVVRYA